MQLKEQAGAASLVLTVSDAADIPEAEALLRKTGADVFIGVSAGLIPEELIASMNDDSIVFALSNLLLAGLIPVVMLTTWIVSGQRPGIVSSVAGRFRF